MCRGSSCGALFPCSLSLFSAMFLFLWWSFVFFIFSVASWLFSDDAQPKCGRTRREWCDGCEVWAVKRWWSSAHLTSLPTPTQAGWVRAKNKMLGFTFRSRNANAICRGTLNSMKGSSFGVLRTLGAISVIAIQYIWGLLLLWPWEMPSGASASASMYYPCALLGV